MDSPLRPLLGRYTIKNLPRGLIIVRGLCLHEFLESSLLLYVLEVMSRDFQLQVQSLNLFLQFRALVKQVCHYLVLDSQLKLCDIGKLSPLFIELGLFLVPQACEVGFLLQQLLLSVQCLVSQSCQLVLKSLDSLLLLLLFVLKAVDKFHLLCILVLQVC